MALWKACVCLCMHYSNLRTVFHYVYLISDEVGSRVENCVQVLILEIVFATLMWLIYLTIPYWSLGWVCFKTKFYFWNSQHAQTQKQEARDYTGEALVSHESSSYFCFIKKFISRCLQSIFKSWEGCGFLSRNESMVEIFGQYGKQREWKNFLS